MVYNENSKQRLDRMIAEEKARKLEVEPKGILKIVRVVLGWIFGKKPKKDKELKDYYNKYNEELNKGGL